MPRYLLRAATAPIIVITTLVFLPDPTARLVVGMIGLILLLADLWLLQQEHSRQIAHAAVLDSIKAFTYLLADPDSVEAMLDSMEEGRVD